MSIKGNKIIVTGMNGTVAPVVARYFDEQGYEIIPFDRNKVNIEDEMAVRQFILEQKPAILLHFALGSENWVKSMAKICYEQDITFLFTSTVDTLSDLNNGPYTIETKVWSKTDYGKYKIRCEEIVRENNPNAYIVRLGWQIGDSAGNNNMIDYLTRQMKEHGVVNASKKWFPSCSFIDDTAKGIDYLINNLSPDTYLLNSNIHSSFYDIVKMISKFNHEISVKEDNSFVRDDRMIDERLAGAGIFWGW